MICKRKRKRLYSCAIVANATFWIFLISLTITCCFNAQVFYHSYEDLELQKAKTDYPRETFHESYAHGYPMLNDSLVLLHQAKYRAPVLEDELKYQKDIEDINIDLHFAQLHSDNMHRVRKPLLQEAALLKDVNDSTGKPRENKYASNANFDKTNDNTQRSRSKKDYRTHSTGKIRLDEPQILQNRGLSDTKQIKSDNYTLSALKNTSGYLVSNKDKDYPSHGNLAQGSANIQPVIPQLSPTHSQRKSGKTGSSSTSNGTGNNAGHPVAKPEHRLPGAIIIGVKKAGTRALLEYLRMHPLIEAPGPEPHFFDKYYNRGLEWYRKQMPVSLPDQLTMEKTPSYFVTKEAPRRIRDMSRNVRLLVVVRNPVTRAISDYVQALQRRPDLPSFEHMAFLDNHTKIVNTSWGGIRIGIYVRSLENWLRYFPQKQLLFVDGERLIGQPGTEMRRVQRFLRIPSVINESHFTFNSTKGFPCLLKPKDKGRPHCLGNTKGRTHPYVSLKARLKLQEFYEPFNQRLFSHIGETFDWNS